MKPVKRIALLFVIVFFIVSFWLYPGINTAGDAQYVRRYEDTENPYPAVAVDTTNHKTSVNEKAADRQTKKYKKEILKSDTKLSKVKLEHFSRAIHFEEEVTLVDADSAKVLEVAVVSDSTRLIQ
jgi:hypothetical protein